MTREELLQVLQEKGLSDDEIRALLEETLETLGKDFEDHDDKIEEDEKEQAKKLLGVEF